MKNVKSARLPLNSDNQVCIVSDPRLRIGLQHNSMVLLRKNSGIFRAGQCGILCNLQLWSFKVSKWNFLGLILHGSNYDFLIDFCISITTVQP